MFHRAAKALWRDTCAMFDLATQPQSAPASGGALALPFDWRLTAPAGLANYPYTDFAAASGIPQVSGEILATYTLALEDGLQTAVILSLFTDSRADRDAVLPLNQTDRRGWVGDEFMSDAQAARQDAWGSALWLVYISKVTPDVLERARFAAQEALAWLVRDGIASRVVVTAQWAGPALDRLALRCAIYKPDQLQPVYDVLWGTTLRRLDALAAPEGAVACCDPPAPAAPPPPPPVARKLAWAEDAGLPEGPFAPENAGRFSYSGAYGQDSKIYFTIVGGFAAGVSVEYVGPGNTDWIDGYEPSINRGSVQMWRASDPSRLTGGMLEIRLLFGGAYLGSISCLATAGEFYPDGRFVSFAPN